MKIRRKLNEVEETLSPEIKPFQEMFLGQIVGVVLRKRGKNDPHVAFQLIHEDDGHWFHIDSGGSSYWFSDYEGVLKAAREWCEENCEPDLTDGHQYGWKFKD